MTDRLVVVTGAGGFVGTALCAHFRERGRPFIGVVRRMRSDLARDLEPVGDLGRLDDAALEDIVGDAQAVVHLAGRAHVLVEAERNPARAYALANAELTARLAAISARSGVARFILASTVKVNGEATRPGHPFRPGDPANPQDAYARSKLAAERSLFETVTESPMRAVVLRFPLVYGLHAKGNFAQLVEAVAAGRRLPFASIRNRRNLLYTGNLVEAIGAAIDTPSLSGVHFVADTEAIATPDLVRAIAFAWRVRPRMFAVPVPLLRLAGIAAGRSAVVARLTDSLEVDTSSFRAATGWAPRWPLDAALARIASKHRDAAPF